MDENELQGMRAVMADAIGEAVKDDGADLVEEPIKFSSSGITCKPKFGKKYSS